MWQASGERVGLDENQALQMDFRCVPGERFRDFFIASQAELETTQQLSGTELAGLRELVAWNGERKTNTTLFSSCCDATTLSECVSRKRNSYRITLILLTLIRADGTRKCRRDPVRNHVACCNIFRSPMLIWLTKSSIVLLSVLKHGGTILDTSWSRMQLLITSLKL